MALGVGAYTTLNRVLEKKHTPAPSSTSPIQAKETKQKKDSEQLTIYRVAVKDNQETLFPIKVDTVSGKDKYESAIFRLITEGESSHTANPIPEGTKLLGLKVKNGLASVNLSKEFRDNFTGGSEGESLTISSILRTLGQFPEIKRVHILVEGKPLDTLGHLDLSEPLDVKWTGSDFGGEN